MARLARTGTRQWTAVVAVLACVVAGVAGPGAWVTSPAAAAPAAVGVPSAPSVPFAPPGVNVAGVTGNDISWPQCGGAFPAQPSVGVVGVNGGTPDTANVCLGSAYGLASEFAWASHLGSAAMLYVNTADPGPSDRAWPAGCGWTPACAYAYGLKQAEADWWVASQPTTAGPGASTVQWWLDVETANAWAGPGTRLPLGVTWQEVNTSVLLGFLHGLGAHTALPVGVYSTRYQWGVITGGVDLGPAYPNWVPGAQSRAQARQMCAGPSVTGGPVTMIQWWTIDYDYDFACQATAAL